jgi:hypothetical protein
MRFTVHRRRGGAIVAGALAALGAIETFAVHLLVHPHAPALAWAITASSAATVAWMIADAIALARGGVIVGDDAIELRIGRRWRARIPRAAIDQLERVSGRVARAPGLVRAGVLGADLIVHLRAPAIVGGPLGVSRRASRIALTLDDPDGFVAAVTSSSAAPATTPRSPRSPTDRPASPASGSA